MTRNSWIIVVMVCALGACGGENADSGVRVSGTPTPAPSSSAPSPTYQSARDFSQDRFSQDFGARAERFRAYAPGVQPRIVSLATTTTLGAISFSYRASPKSYSVSYLNEARLFTRLQPADLAALTGDQDYDPADTSPTNRYFRVVESNPSFSADDRDYVGFSSWITVSVDEIESGERGDREIVRYQLYGAHTQTTDLPKSGTSTYRLRFPPLKDAIDLQINWSTGIVEGSSRVACNQDEPCPAGDVGELRLTGSFDGSFRILGTISGNSGYTGTFVGGFYGPRALEMGIVGDYRHVTRHSHILVATAKRRS